MFLFLNLFLLFLNGFIGLLKLGNAKVGRIIGSVRVSSSNVHDALDKLVKKGLVSFILKNNIKEYSSSPPESLKLLINQEKELVKEKELKLNSLLANLSSIRKVSEPVQSAEIYAGLNGIKSGFKKLIHPAHRTQKFLFFYKYDRSNIEIVHKFFSKLDIEDYYNRVPTQGLFSKEYKPFFKERKKNKIEAKFTTHIIPSSVNIYGDNVLIIAWGENPIGFLIQSKEVARTFQVLFEEIWKDS